ncbi:MAG TPA: hypothetical protein VK509_04755, partial [Polyangiales bacterium]|nr:hypothetical protein [Polyangiales bacterium]
MPRIDRRTRMSVRGLVAAMAAALLVAGSGGPASAADGRAYELVSPPEKNGGEVTGNATRTRAATDGNAVMFNSLTGFADVIGTGFAVEYVGERSSVAGPGTNGWGTHAITPRQKSQGVLAGVLALEPFYQGRFSADLSHGVFRAWSPLTDAPNVANQLNLYTRNDLLEPGPGSYALLSD